MRKPRRVRRVYACPYGHCVFAAFRAFTVSPRNRFSRRVTGSRCAGFTQARIPASMIDVHPRRNRPDRQLVRHPMRQYLPPSPPLPHPQRPVSLVVHRPLPWPATVDHVGICYQPERTLSTIPACYGGASRPGCGWRGQAGWRPLVGQGCTAESALMPHWRMAEFWGTFPGRGGRGESHPAEGAVAEVGVAGEGPRGEGEAGRRAGWRQTPPEGRWPRRTGQPWWWRQRSTMRQEIGERPSKRREAEAVQFRRMRVRPIKGWSLWGRYAVSCAWMSAMRAGRRRGRGIRRRGYAYRAWGHRPSWSRRRSGQRHARRWRMVRRRRHAALHHAAVCRVFRSMASFSQFSLADTEQNPPYPPFCDGRSVRASSRTIRVGLNV